MERLCPTQMVKTMHFSRSFKMAISSIVSSKMRSLLTMLGIIIGVGSVIVIVSLVEGFTNTMTSTFESLGTNIVTMSVTQTQYMNKIIDDEIFEFVAENSSEISGVSPTVSVSATLKNGVDTTSTTGTGVSEHYIGMYDKVISEGYGISYLNCANYDKVIVIGAYNAHELFGFDSPIGEYVKVNGENYKVIGVLEQSSSLESGTADDTFLIPYTSATKLSRYGAVTTYAFSSASNDNVDQAKSLIEGFYTEKLGSSDYYTSFALSDMLAEVDILTGMLTMLLVGIASISLLVGGIGIMNIMLVSVTERTREIGIRKSLGGKRKDILAQFIIESGVTSSIGGIIGVILGIIVSYIVATPIGIDVTISIPAVLISFGISVFIGVFFGYFPALKASKLNPIDALRFD